MGRSDSSDSDSHSNRHRSRKKKHRRSRSRSSSSDRSHSRSSRKHKSHHHRSHKDKKHKDSRHRSRERSPPRSRDRSRDNSPYRGSRSRHHSESDSEFSKSSKNNVKRSNIEKSTTENEDRFNSMSLKDRVHLLVSRSSDNVTSGWDVQQQPTLDQIADIEDDGFVQQSFSSTIVTNKPKKKGKKSQNLQASKHVEDKPKISHDNAIFGAVTDTMHALKFTSRIDEKRQKELKSIEDDDVMFGAVFNEDPEIRKQRWIQKLRSMREKINAENVKSERST